MTKKSRIKSEAAAVVFQNPLEVNAAIEQIGAAQRERDALQTAMNDELAAVRARYEDQALPHASVIKELGHGVQLWCESNRVDLTKDNRIKTHKFAAGEVSWRQRPPSVAIRGQDAVLAALRALNLDRFIRRKEEVDKEAILRDPAAVESVKGVSVSSQGEFFVIKPFETQLEELQ